MIDPPLPGVTILHGPQDWQILQRNEDDDTASLHIDGVYRTDAPEFRVEARLVRERDGAPVTSCLDWTPAWHDESGNWSLVLEYIPPGGLYRLETRLWRRDCPDTRPMRGDYVHHLGVGDIWVIAGQSNASGTGTGYVDDPPAFGVHQLGNDEVWKVASHPLEDATRSRHPITVHGVFQGHSPWLAFGRRLQDALNLPIGLIPTALGGSPLSRWAPGADLYENLRDMVALAGGRIAGVVWYQGESDCNAAALSTYAERFTRFVEALRRDLDDPDLPVVTAQLGRHAAPDFDAAREAAWTGMREAQRRIAADVLKTPLVPTVDLPLCDEIHISAAANVVLGNRFADAALRCVYGRDAPLPGIALRQARHPAAELSRVVLEFEHPSAGWCHVGDVRDFAVEDADGEIPVVETQFDDKGVVTLALARQAVGPVTTHAHRGSFPQPALRDRDQRPILAFSVVATGS